MLPPQPPVLPTRGGRLAENVMHFARVLRGAGIPVGPAKVLDALQALQVAGVERRDDFYWTLASVFIDKREQFELFDQAFHIFWRDPRMLERAMALLLPKVHGRMSPDEPQMPTRLAEALAPPQKQASQSEGKEADQEIEIDAAFTASEREVLKHADFEFMTGAELAEAKKLITNLRLPLPPVPTRRLAPHPHGRHIDLRRSLRAALRSGSAMIPLERRAPQERHPPLVILCDISGSMNRYSRMFLHFLHAISQAQGGHGPKVHAFVFGTRLTNITRYLRDRDVDVALAAVSRAVGDWSGGTRIGICLKEFNLRWARRVLGQNAVVLMITDGLDRDPGKELAEEAERLHKSCRRLIWLNPLLRYGGFEPRPAGVRLMLPHVDDFLPVHNIRSLLDLARVLASPSAERAKNRSTGSAARGSAAGKSATITPVQRTDGGEQPWK